MQHLSVLYYMLSVALSYRSIAPSLLPGLKASVIMDYESRRETKPFRALRGDGGHDDKRSD